MYKYVAVADIKYEKDKISGTLFNYGIQEVTIPELIFSYYDENKELLWVNQDFMREGVRVQRKQYFDYDLPNLEMVTIINSSMENIFVNGLPNKEIAIKVIPDRQVQHPKEQMQTLAGKGYHFIKLELNNYVGNPK